MATINKDEYKLLQVQAVWSETKSRYAHRTYMHVSEISDRAIRRSPSPRVYIAFRSASQSCKTCWPVKPLTRDLSARANCERTVAIESDASAEHKV